MLTQAELRVPSMMLTLKGLWTALAGSLPFLRSPQTPRRTATPSVQSARMTPAQQWDKVAGVLSSAIESAASAKDLHASAAQQLDLATYALYNLFDELSSVLSEPLVREAAVIHRLPPKTRRAQAQALAA